MRSYGDHSEIWESNPNGDGGHVIPISGAPANLGQAIASEDAIVFVDGDGGINRVARDGSHLTPLFHGPAEYPSFINNGRDLVFLRFSATEGQKLWSVPVAGGTAHQVWSSFVVGHDFHFSTDGATTFVVRLGSDGQGQGMVLHFGAERGARGARVRAFSQPGPAAALGSAATLGAPTEIPIAAYDHSRMKEPFSVTPDGRNVTYIAEHGSTDNIWALPIAGGPAFPLTHFSDFKIADYAFNRDGRLAVSRLTPNGDAVIATGLTAKH